MEAQMNNFNFKLTPAYCLYNSVAVFEENGSYIKFIMENDEDDLLKKRLSIAFEKHIHNVTKFIDCPEVFKSELKIEFQKCKRADIRKSVSNLYTEDGRKTISINETKKEEKDAAAVLLLDTILSEASKKSATDIHIEKNKVSFRINGILEKQMQLQKSKMKELIQRIKILSGMNVLDSRKSQDGHFIYGNKSPLFIRVSSMAVVGENYNGDESIVLRLLDTSRIPLAIEYLGFTNQQQDVLRKIEMEKNGLVLVCGPTGSGKSTTVASMLIEIIKKSEGKLKIISLEDPPEYVIPEISQIQIEENKNSYKSALEHVFRQDPDVIMIGEIRDEISASAAIRASLTGHLVFATVHTGSVGESILRLENLGVNRKLLCSVLRGVVCQELHFLGEGMKLYADIGIPKNDFSKKVKTDMGNEELDELFCHFTNYSNIFSKTLEILSKKDDEITQQLKGKKHSVRRMKVWNGGNNVGKIHQGIV